MSRSTRRDSTIRILGAGLATALLLAVALPVLAGSGDETIPEPEGNLSLAEQAALDRARAAVKGLGGELMQRMAGELGAGGPEAAIHVCSEEAQEISSSYSVDGLEIKRVSLKLRNPADSPDQYVRLRLVGLHRQHDAGELPPEVVEVVEDETGGRSLLYLKPILVKGLCLQCHGGPNDLSPEIDEILHVEYPHDQATGYQEGDLRGAFSVRVAL